MDLSNNNLDSNGTLRWLWYRSYSESFEKSEWDWVELEGKIVGIPTTAQLRLLRILRNTEKLRRLVIIWTRVKATS